MKRRTKAPRGYSARRISLIDLGPQLSRQLLGCILAHRPIYIQHGLHQAIRILSVMYTGITNSDAPRWHHFWNMRTTTHIPIVHARKRILSHRDCSTRCSQFPIFNCNPLPIEYLPLQQKLSIFPTLLPRSRNELKPSVTVRKGTNAHACLAVVLSPLF